MNTETVMGIVIDISSRTFLLFGTEGSIKTIECQTVNQFMDILKLSKSNFSEDQISYADLLVESK